MTDLPNNPTLTIKIGPDSGKVFSLQEGTFILGRKPPADIIIEHSLISTQHARLTLEGGRAFLEDLESRNGTFINKQRVEGRRELKDGEEFSLGPIIRLAYSTGVPSQKTEAWNADKIQAAMAAAEDGRTVVDISASQVSQELSKGGVPPELWVTIAGQAMQTYPLDKGKITIGRAEDNDILINSMIVSRHHATLHLGRKGYEVEVMPGATNTLSRQGCPVTERTLLAHGDVLRIESDIPGQMVSMSYQAPLTAAARVPFNIEFGDREKLTFGRDAQNDVVLDMPSVSRYHAQVSRVGRRYFVTDLHSANGTYVNDKRVSGNVWLEPQDTLRIGPYRLVLGEDAFTRYDEGEQGVKVEAYHLNKQVRKNLNLLQDISLSFQPREFIAIVGQSGGGKSTLLDAIAGYRPATHGQVIVNNIDIYKNFDAIRSAIGYVPQKDIIHMELTVYQALDYAAQLRMPRDTSKEERHKRIMEVLSDLDLAHRKDVQISGLSGGQQKRVSIGVELLTRPSLFYLDEPTSGLDPGTETTFMHLMRRLADQGRTIVMVTHATKNVMLADKVVFLARGGYVAWYGPPDAALAYFDKYRTEQERRTKPMEFDEIYTILDNPKMGKASEWSERYQSDEVFDKFVVQPLNQEVQTMAAGQAAPAVRKTRGKGASISGLHQFFILFKRNLAIIRRDRFALILMLGAAPVVGALDFFLAPAMGRATFSFQTGDANNGILTMFMLTLNTLLVGGMSQMREFVKEANIYKRERLVNLRIFPYVSSKIMLAFLFAFWQAAAYTAIHYIAFKMPGGISSFLAFYVTIFLAVFAGMMLGLLASAVAPNAASAPLTAIMFIIPLIVLSGILAPIPNAVSQFASTRWSFQSLVGLSGAGSDVASDVCWHLDKDLQNGMNLDDKAIWGCKCMGLKVFDENSCNFPGIGKLYTAEIDQPEPVLPPALGDRPPEPTIPEAPAPPDDTYDQVKMAQYMNALVAYQDQVKLIQDAYRNEMDLFQVQADVYTGQMRVYQEELATYKIIRFSAVKGAEATIQKTAEKFGWTWVDKSDPLIYYPWLIKTWVANLLICLIYFVIMLILIKRKDVK
jgi:ABC-type multidrug transport system ATPase subunit/pSer/pThr/pTyr-binding forkhead associated (FHA) protein